MIGIAAGVAITGAVVEGIKSLVSIQKVQAQTGAVIKSTASAAGQALDQITARSQKWSLAIGRNEEDVQNLQNILLTFTNIGSKVFDETTTAALDMSQALGVDVKESAIQLGKALNDPIKGVTALRRVGVAFTEDQIKQINVLVKSGKTLDAQRLILAELQKEFGGSAATYGNTMEGQFERLKQAVQGAERALAEALLPPSSRSAARYATSSASPRPSHQSRGSARSSPVRSTSS